MKYEKKQAYLQARIKAWESLKNKQGYTKLGSESHS